MWEQSTLDSNVHFNIKQNLMTEKMGRSKGVLREKVSFASFWKGERKIQGCAREKII